MLTEYIYTVIDGSTHAEQDIDMILRVLNERKLTYLLPAILKDLELLHSRKVALSLPRITCAVDPTEETIARIKTYIGATDDSAVAVSVDKDLVGGFYVEYEGKIYDGSVRTYVDTIKRALQVM